MKIFSSSSARNALVFTAVLFTPTKATLDCLFSAFIDVTIGVPAPPSPHQINYCDDVTIYATGNQGLDKRDTDVLEERFFGKAVPKANFVVSGVELVCDDIFKVVGNFETIDSASFNSNCGSILGSIELANTGYAASSFNLTTSVDVKLSNIGKFSFTFYAKAAKYPKNLCCLPDDFGFKFNWLKSKNQNLFNIFTQVFADVSVYSVQSASSKLNDLQVCNPKDFLKKRSSSSFKESGHDSVERDLSFDLSASLNLWATSENVLPNFCWPCVCDDSTSDDSLSDDTVSDSTESSSSDSSSSSSTQETSSTPSTSATSSSTSDSSSTIQTTSSSTSASSTSSISSSETSDSSASDSSAPTYSPTTESSTTSDQYSSSSSSSTLPEASYSTPVSSSSSTYTPESYSHSVFTSSSEIATTYVSTVTAKSSTVITVTSCSDHVCTEVPVTTGIVVVTDYFTSYTTYCPLTATTTIKGKTVILSEEESSVTYFVSQSESTVTLESIADVNVETSYLSATFETIAVTDERTTYLSATLENIAVANEETLYPSATLTKDSLIVAITTTATAKEKPLSSETVVAPYYSSGNVTAPVVTATAEGFATSLSIPFSIVLFGCGLALI